MRRHHPFRLGLPVAAVAFALDQASKTVILMWLMDPPRVIPVVPFLNLVLSFNTGVTFGLGRSLGVEGAWLLAAFAGAVVAFLVRWLARSDGWAEAVGIGLVIGGGLTRDRAELESALATDIAGRAETSPFLRRLDLVSRIRVLDNEVPVAAIGAALLPGTSEPVGAVV